MKCIDCAGELVPTTTSYNLDSIPPIEIQYLEAYKCLQCGEVFLTRSSIKKIESIEEKLHESNEISWSVVKV